MALLRSASGALLLSGGGVPLLASGPNPSAPPIVRPPSGLSFDMAVGSKKGWPGSNNQGQELGDPRDWQANFADAQESFGGVRWMPTWLETLPAYAGEWQPAGGDVWRVYRKGELGRDAQTLVLECGPNSATVPAGDYVVLWTSSAPGDYQGGTLGLSGYNLPLRKKMLVIGGQGSAYGVPTGRRTIEIDTGTELPGIDYTAPTHMAGPILRSGLQHRHWSFYADNDTKTLRHPLGWFCDLTVNSALANGGYVVVGGHQFMPNSVDWSREYTLLGASLTEELYRLQCEGLAAYLGLTDPRALAVELEHEPVQPWDDGVQGTGFGTLLAEVWYPLSRTAWGPERTLIVKPTGRASLNSLIDEFDFACPTGANAHVAVHAMDGTVQSPSGPQTWTDIGQTEWFATQLRGRINTLGYNGGGATLLGIDAGHAQGDWDRGQRLGRLLTSLTAQNLYMFAWSLVGDNARIADIQSVNGHEIEAYWRGAAPYSRRAGIMTV